MLSLDKARYVFLASTVYAVWWLFLDSTPRIGETVGRHYQLLNVVGHFLPVLAFVWMNREQWEIGVSAGVFSTLIMDSPLWGVFQQYAYGVLPYGYDWLTWSSLYFNPFVDKVWWGLDLFPFPFVIPVTSILMFTSVSLRWVLVAYLLHREFFQ